MVKRGNALDWYHDEYCGHCDVPGDPCTPGSSRELACLLAAILHELTARNP